MAKRIFCINSALWQAYKLGVKAERGEITSVTGQQYIAKLSKCLVDGTPWRI